MQKTPPPAAPTPRSFFLPGDHKFWRHLCLIFALLVIVWASFWVRRHPEFRADVEIPGLQQSAGVFASGWWKTALEFNATRRLPVIDGDLLSISFAPDGTHGWLLGAGNVLLYTSDGGATWTQLDITSSFPSGATAAQAVTSKPVAPSKVRISVQTTEATAEEFKNTASKPATNLAPQQGPPSEGSVDPKADPPSLNRARGNYPAGATPGPSSSSKGGRIATNIAFGSFRPRADELNRVVFSDSKKGAGEAANTNYFSTLDGGLTWTPTSFSAIDTPKSRRDFQIGGETKIGEVTFFLDQKTFSISGEPPQPLPLQTPFDAAAASPDVFWVVGDKGEALHSIDRGKSWQHVALPTTAKLYTVQFTDADHGWIAGANGILLRTTDGGATWWHSSRRQTSDPAAGVVPYFWLPPPWWWLCVVASLGLVWAGWNPPKVVVKTTVEDVLLTDRPLEPGERDLLGHASRALGLSAFIRNTRTQPPLTIAITGEWGSGKSSLMNLLRGDLKHHGLRPVWFNAWHHQTEEHLLAALLANVRSQAVPYWWLPGGVAFRFRLLAKRVWQEKARWTLIAASLLFFTGLLQAHGPWSLEQVFEQAAALWNNFSLAEPAKGAEAAATTLPKVGGFTGLLIAGVLGLFQLLRALRAFGVEPASLLAAQSNNPKLEDLEKQTSFRYNFAREFAEVTEALGARRMVIFIDDLDRCQPKQVYEMLESVNFLVSSGRCFIVLGLAIERVERAVGLALKNVADAELPSKTAEENPAETARRRADYARHYLGKLINIEVRVPVATTKNYADLLRQRGQSPEETTTRRRFRSHGMLVLGIVLFVLVLGGIFDLGRHLGHAKPIETIAKPEKTTVATGGAAGTAETTDNTADTRGNTIATFNAGAHLFDPWWIFGPVALVLAGIVLWRWRAAAPVEETDSEEFSNSLDHWLPVAASVPGVTPRSLKRFVNRVRYYAMLQKSLFSPAEKIPEGKLVALSAYQERYPEDVEKSAVPLAGLAEEKDKEKSGPLLREFSSPPWIIDDTTYHRFRSLSVGVNFRGDEPHAPEAAEANVSSPARNNDSSRA